MELAERLPYLCPAATPLPLVPDAWLCVSTGTEPFDDQGDYNWGP